MIKKRCDVRSGERERMVCQYINDGCVPNVKSFVILQILQPFKICRVTSLFWLMTKHAFSLRGVTVHQSRQPKILTKKRRRCFIIKKTPQTIASFANIKETIWQWKGWPSDSIGTMGKIFKINMLFVKNPPYMCPLQSEMLIKHRRRTCNASLASIQVISWYMDTIISTINVMIYSDALMRNFRFIRSREDSF